MRYFRKNICAHSKSSKTENISTFKDWFHGWWQALGSHASALCLIQLQPGKMGVCVGGGVLTHGWSAPHGPTLCGLSPTSDSGGFQLERTAHTFSLFFFFYCSKSLSYWRIFIRAVAHAELNRTFSPKIWLIMLISNSNFHLFIHSGLNFTFPATFTLLSTSIMLG